MTENYDDLGWLKRVVAEDEDESVVHDWVNYHITITDGEATLSDDQIQFYVTATRILRNGRFFRSVDVLAQRLFGKGVRIPKLMCDWAQAMYEHGRFTEAIQVLRDVETALLPKPTDVSDVNTKQQLAEVYGHLGRAYKDLALWARPNSTEPRECDLYRSVEYYRLGYLLDESANYWHGVNIVAIGAYRNRIAGSANTLEPKDETLAQQLLVTVNKQLIDQSTRDDGGIDPWLYATRGELHLALGDEDASVEDYRDFAAKAPNRFAPASAARQLHQLWGLHENTAPGYRILPLLHNKSIELQGPLQVNLKPGINLQAIYGDVGWVNLTWWRQFLGLSHGVIRIRDRVRQHWIGSGFLLKGESLSQEWAGKTLLVTCHHVIGIDRTPGVPAIDPKDAEFFVMLPDKTNDTITGHVKVNPTPLRSWPDIDLDVTILEVEPLPEGANVLDGDPSPLKAGPKEKVYVMGYVSDPELKISFDDNALLEARPDGWLCYRAPTTNGFSGGPVFNRQLRVIGVHSRADRDQTYNMGMSLAKVTARLHPTVTPAT